MGGGHRGLWKPFLGLRLLWEPAPKGKSRMTPRMFFLEVQIWTEAALLSSGS